MPVLAMVDGVKIEFYPDEHPPPHFHARIAEFIAQIEIRTGRVMNGSLPPAKLKRVLDWTLSHRSGLMSAWTAVEEFRKPEKMMTNILAMKSAEPIIFGVIKIVWADGFAGIVDLRPLLGKGPMFKFLCDDPSRFDHITLEEFGHKIFWLDDDGDEIDFGSQSLRQRAERQVGLLNLAS